MNKLFPLIIIAIFVTGCTGMDSMSEDSMMKTESNMESMKPTHDDKMKTDTTMEKTDMMEKPMAEGSM